MAPLVSVLMGFDCVAEMRSEKGFYFTFCEVDQRVPKFE